MRSVSREQVVNPDEGKRMRLLFVDATLPDSLNAIHRCTPIARELEHYGFQCKVIFRPNIATILRTGLKSRIIIFRRYIYPWTFLLAILFRLLRKLVVLDIDDSVFMPSPGMRAGWFYAPIFWVLTVLMMLSSSVITVGSHFLKDFASRYNRRVFLVPTPVDTGLFYPRKLAEKTDEPSIGWFASSDSHFEFLKRIKESLVRLSREVPFRLKLLGAARFQRTRDIFADVPFPVDITPWVNFEEIPEHIAEFDVNLYPLTDDAWSRGKCAMKILEAMGMEIPSVASRVGENPYIINDGEDGLMATTSGEWVDKLRLLITDPKLKKQMGQRGRKKVIEEYSQEAIGRQYASILRQCLQGSAAAEHEG